MSPDSPLLPRGSHTRPRGVGSSRDPWDLQTALNGGDANQVRPGDTLWLKGGRYRGYFVSLLRGTRDCPIDVRAVDGHRVVLDAYVGFKTSCPSWSIPNRVTGVSRNVVSGGTYCACKPGGSPDTESDRDDCNPTCAPYFDDECGVTKFPSADDDGGYCNPSQWSDKDDEKKGHFAANHYAALSIPRCSHDVHLVGLELMSSEPGGRVFRSSVDHAANGTYHQRADSGALLDIEGERVAVINAIVHDGRAGIHVGNVKHVRIEGSLVFNNGIIDPQGLGTGIYLQGRSGGSLAIGDSVLWNNFANNNFHVNRKGGDPAQLMLDRTFALNAGGPSATAKQNATSLAPTFHKTSEDPSEIRISNSGFAYPGSLGATGPHLDIQDLSAARISCSTLSGAATALIARDVSKMSFRDNTVVRQTCCLIDGSPTCVEKPLVETSAVGVGTWDDNHYFDTAQPGGSDWTANGLQAPFSLGGSPSVNVAMSSPEWRAHHDAHSDLSRRVPPNKTIVRPIRVPRAPSSRSDEYGRRAHVIVYNWDERCRVGFFLDEGKFQPGSHVDLHDMQRLGSEAAPTNPAGSPLDKFLGTPVWSGVYQPGQPVFVDMCAGKDATSPIGLALESDLTTPAQVPHTAPALGAFLVLATPPRNSSRPRLDEHPSLISMTCDPNSSADGWLEQQRTKQPFVHPSDPIEVSLPSANVRALGGDEWRARILLSSRDTRSDAGRVLGEFSARDQRPSDDAPVKFEIVVPSDVRPGRYVVIPELQSAKARAKAIRYGGIPVDVVAKAP